MLLAMAIPVWLCLEWSYVSLPTEVHSTATRNRHASQLGFMAFHGPSKILSLGSLGMLGDVWGSGWSMLQPSLCRWALEQQDRHGIFATANSRKACRALTAVDHERLH